MTGKCSCVMGLGQPEVPDGTITCGNQFRSVSFKPSPHQGRQQPTQLHRHQGLHLARHHRTHLQEYPRHHRRPPFLPSWIPSASTSHSVSSLLSRFSSARPFINPALRLSSLVRTSNRPTLGQHSGAGASSARPVLCNPQHSRTTLSKPQRLPSPSKRAISLFLSRSLPAKWGFSFLCARDRKSCPWIASLIVSLLLSSADFKSRPELKVLPPAISHSPQVTLVIMNVGY